MQQQDLFLSWFAGILDGEGCFTIVLGKQRTANSFLAVKPQIRVGFKFNEKEETALQYIQDNIHAGKIYYANKGKENGTISWQTTRIIEAIEVAKKVIPYLVIKKEKAKLFVKVLEMWDSTRQADSGKRSKGLRLRTKEEVLYLVQVATTLNSGRQTKRYRDYKGYDYWKPLIDKWYPEK